MLFNSYVFLFVFLPVAVFCFGVLSRRGQSGLALWWLAAVSLFFYGWFSPQYLLLLLASIIINHYLGTRLLRTTAASGNGQALLLLGVALNLGFIGYFKYIGMAAQTANAILGLDFNPGDIALPLGISFYTFQQIAFLVDCRQGKAKQTDFIRYLLFVTFFPKLITGPIVRHSEIIDQFERAASRGLSAANIVIGLTIMVIGLFKKVIIADQMAVYANPLFAAAAAGQAPGLAESWAGVLAYAFQIYFDFSGYSDMAVGLGRIFGVRLPVNFLSPYRAACIIDFWRHWHMTLSRFLKDYLYIPLGGNRLGQRRRYVNLMIAMLLGGLWHGAAWTFVIWGGLHGFYLAVNHGWRAFRRRLGFVEAATSAWGLALSWLITFLAVTIAWVFFRAESFGAALDILNGMAGFNDLFAGQDILPIGTRQTRWLAGLSVVVVFAPNTYEIMARYSPALGLPSRLSRHWPRHWTGKWLQWRATWPFAILSAAVAVIAILGLTRVTEFLYFQF